MPRPCSMDLRERTVARVTAGEIFCPVTSILQASVASVVDYRVVWTFVHAEGLSFRKSVRPSE